MLLIRKILCSGVLAATLIICNGWLPHKFYVSLTEVKYNTLTERFEVSMRIFPDDLDQAFMEKSGIRTQLATELEHEKADSLLKAYLLDSFSIDSDGQLVDFTYLGKEQESDAIWCYLESNPVSAPRDLSIRNELLTEFFPEQVNIVQVYIDTWNKGLLLNRTQSSGELTIGK